MASKITFLSFFVTLSFPIFFSPSRGNIGNETKSSAFEFIKHLQGCQKGTKVQGIHNLKLYLARFGYLNYQHTPNHNNEEDENFDEELEAAVKSYQNFYHLNISGTLDGPTVLQMFMPRCGQSDKKTHQHGSLHTVSRFKFYPPGHKWPQGFTNLKYAFGFFFPKSYVPIVVRALNKWASASSGYFTFTRVDNTRIADLKIDFLRRDHGDGNPFDGPGGVLAHASAPTNGVLHYDADEKWSEKPAPNTYDFETASLHEIGHLLGLDHS